MKKSYIIPVAAALFFAGCSKENPFTGETGGTGQFLKSALSMDVKADALEQVKAPGMKDAPATRAEANPDDFTVVFMKEGQSAPVAKYKYGEMPEVVTLTEGTYSVTATYGENRDADWDNPYFLGVSEKFDVVPYEITSYIEPIECRLENVMVSIKFDAALRTSMSSDSYVEVKVGDNAGLNFSQNDVDAERAAYFKHTSETTLVATFHGKVNGAEVVESKSFKDVEKGNHYRITFKLHRGSSDSDGDITGDVAVDASVEVQDVERNIPLGEETLLEDTERPREDGDEPGPGPEEPTAPEMKIDAPLNLESLNLVKVGDTVRLVVTSSSAAGFTGFTCDIDSPSLTPEELQGAGLDSHLDLVNPGALDEALTGLGFTTNVGGMKTVEFNLTGFVPMLAAFIDIEHDFILTVTDEYGTTVKTLRLKVVEE